uniref:Uncharacterized protein n=1 Tax=Tetranychus urticae TaxID=32264 RepID=T1KIQ2_TETUR
MQNNRYSLETEAAFGFGKVEVEVELSILRYNLLLLAPWIGHFVHLTVAVVVVAAADLLPKMVIRPLPVITLGPEDDSSAP